MPTKPKSKPSRHVFANVLGIAILVSGFLWVLYYENVTKPARALEAQCVAAALEQKELDEEVPPQVLKSDMDIALAFLDHNINIPFAKLCGMLGPDRKLTVGEHNAYIELCLPFQTEVMIREFAKAATLKAGGKSETPSKTESGLELPKPKFQT